MKPQLKERPLFDVIDAMQKDAETPRRFNEYYLGIGDGSAPILELVKTGVVLKAEGMANAMKPKPSAIYKGRLEDALLHFGVGALITVEQLTGIAGRPETWGAHFNSVGAIINGMAKRGLIEKTGRMIQAQRPSLHASELAQWRVVKYANTKRD